MYFSTKIILDLMFFPLFFPANLRNRKSVKDYQAFFKIGFVVVIFYIHKASNLFRKKCLLKHSSECKKKMYNHILPRVNSQQDFLHACNIYLPINVCKIDFEIPGYLKAYCEGYN